MQPSLSDGKSAKSTNRGTCIETFLIGSIYIKDTCARKDTSVGDIFFIGGTYVKSVFVRDVCIGNICIRTIDAIGYSVMYL